MGDKSSYTVVFLVFISKSSLIHLQYNVKEEWSRNKDQKVSLNFAKKDHLCAIALMKRKYILKVLLKIVAMTIS